MGDRDSLGALSPRDGTVRLGIACGTGGFKGAFISGVLAAFEQAGVRAGMYAAASSSVLPCAYAAIGQAAQLGVAYWIHGLELIRRAGLGMSHMVLQGLYGLGPLPRQALFQPGAPRFLVAANEVVTLEGRRKTQGKGSRRLGRELLLATARGDLSWVEANLVLRLFDTQPGLANAQEADSQLQPGNFEAVVYASSRLLHAWDIPAWLGGRAYVDAAYTCTCPALAVAQRGCPEVLAILTDPGPPYMDLFQSSILPEMWNGARIQIIQPRLSLEDLGVEVTRATEAGLEAAFQHGIARGGAFLDTMDQPLSGSLHAGVSLV